MLKLIKSGMLDFRDLGLDGIERLCQVNLTWKLVSLYYCPKKEGKACIVFVCSQLAIFMVSSTSTPLQILILINGNKMIVQFVKDIESRVHSVSSQDCEACQICSMF